MRLLQGILGGLAVCAAGTAFAGDAVLPESPATSQNQVVPLDYVRVCDDSDAAYLIVPGTEECLVLGGHRRDAPDSDLPARGAGLYPADIAIALTGAELDRGALERWTEHDFLGPLVPRREELLAYTATFGEGFAPMMSFPDPASPDIVPLTSIASLPDASPISINGISAPSFRGGPAGEVQAIVGNIRQDQPLGAVQLDAAAALQVRAGLFASQAQTAPSPAYPIPVPPSSPYGLSGTDGPSPNMDYLSPGDRLWLQAAYENGSFGTIADSAPDSTSFAAPASRFGRAVVAPFDSVSGWRSQPDMACVGTGSFTCEPRSGPANNADASNRPRPPTFGSAVTGPSQELRYEPGAIAGFGGAVAMPDSKQTKAGPSFIGMPISGFDIGAEFMYIKVKQARPAAAPTGVEEKGAHASGEPSAKGTPAEYQGRLRVQPAF